MLAGIYYGAMYGGSTTAILLGLPGESASTVTCIDGHRMAQQGRAGAALGIAAIGSFIDGTIALVGLSLIAPPLAALALKFGPPEYFALALFGLFMVSSLTNGPPRKAALSATVGLLLACIGQDPIYGTLRFNLGLVQLSNGIEFTVLAMGLFGVGEILYNLERPNQGPLLQAKVGRLWPSLRDWSASKHAVLRGSFLGFLIGALPGGGAVIASIFAYSVEKKMARDASRFGQGAIEGVAAPEAANNAAAGAAFIPLLTLGIPGNSVMALLYAALMMHGVQPGPFVLQEHPDLFWSVIASMYLGNVFLLLLNLPLVGLFAYILRVKRAILTPIILLVSLTGVYSINHNTFDILLLGLFGAIGYLMRKLRYDVGPMVLAFALGPILEKSFRQSLLLSNGSLEIFLTRPITVVIFLIILVVFGLKVGVGKIIR